MFKRLIPGFLGLAIAATPMANAGDITFYTTHDVASSNREIGASYMPFQTGDSRFGFHVASRREGAIPYANNDMFGIGIGGETDISDETGIPGLTAGGKLQGYFSSGLYQDTDGNGFVDTSTGYGHCELLQAYLKWKIKGGLNALLALTGKRTGFHKRVSNLETGDPDLDAQVELGLSFTN